MQMGYFSCYPHLNLLKQTCPEQDSTGGGGGGGEQVAMFSLQHEAM